jgi:dihydrofolate synthase / folylpolyglutamate synthase
MNQTTRTLTQWLDTLQQRYQQEIDLGLTRVAEVAKHLGILRPDCLIITVAGTNGKGSTCAYIDAIARAHGMSVGRFSSPHLLAFNERIVINGTPITDAVLIQYFEQIETARKDTKITYYEFSALAAMLAYVEAGVDLAVLEVGLGGRLDAVNIWDADVAVVTTVDLDHQQYLGDTRELIAYEKAGIFRHKKPAICGDATPPQSLVAHAQAIEANLTILKPQPSVQQQNAACARMAMAFLINLDEQKTQDALTTTKLPGRLQRVEYRGHPLILDVAHNPQAARTLAEFLRYNFDGSTLHAVFSILDDKDIDGVIAAMAVSVHTWHIAPLNTPRAMSVERIAKAIGDGNKVRVCDSIEAALKQAMDSSTKPIVVFGSFYVVADVLTLITSSSVTT